MEFNVMTAPDNHARLLNAYADMNAGRYAEAKEALERLLKDGERRAALYLGWMYERGLGVPVNENHAANHFEMLARENDPEGSYYAASLRLKRGDAAGALAGFVLAAEAGNASAAYWASAIYGGEKGFPVDAAKAAAYLTKAASLGHVFAQRDLAKQRLRESKSMPAKTEAMLSYIGAKLKGLAMIAKNTHDPRVR
jgi:TPR repeat protein